MQPSAGYSLTLSAHAQVKAALLYKRERGFLAKVPQRFQPVFADGHTEVTSGNELFFPDEAQRTRLDEFLEQVSQQRRHVVCASLWAVLSHVSWLALRHFLAVL